jgi:glucose-6-phosphate 1-dehydrogenase
MTTEMVNPFSGSFDRISKPNPTAIVIFGATGDLTARKLLPALANLAEDGYLPERFIVVGVARRPVGDEGFRNTITEAVKKFSRRPIRPDVWDTFSKQIFYQPVRFSEQVDYEALRDRLYGLEQGLGQKLNFLYYLATAPEHFAEIATHLKGAGLVEPAGTGRITSIVVEKPFGHDLKSARELNVEIRKSFAEDQIFRIDHYLGKETVQNIMVFRFANGIFEPLWNHKYIDHIQISVSEDLGVGSRAGYFDQSGIMRDILQNHVLQMLSLLCIEPPINLQADSIRDEKVKVLKSMRRIAPAEVATTAVRAQYTAGFIEGKPVKGYLEEDGVKPHSVTETYAAVRLAIDNWRWAGVPIYIRVGKRMPKRITEITVYFKNAPDAIFRGHENCTVEQNVLAIQVQPRESITLKISSKPPGLRMRLQPVVMEFSYGSSFGMPSPEAYERLLLDAMRGDATLFTRDDEIEESWDLLAPILESWSSPDGPPVHEYEAGSWGPTAAATLLKPGGHSWRRL